MRTLEVEMQSMANGADLSEFIVHIVFRREQENLWSVASASCKQSAGLCRHLYLTCMKGIQLLAIRKSLNAVSSMYMKKSLFVFQVHLYGFQLSVHTHTHTR